MQCVRVVYTHVKHETHVFPVADVAAELLEGAETPVVEHWQRERAEHAHVQRAYGLALTEREEQPIRHVKLFPTALRDVRVDGHGSRVRVLPVQYGSRVFQQPFCAENEKKTKQKLGEYYNNIILYRRDTATTLRFVSSRRICDIFTMFTMSFSIFNVEFFGNILNGTLTGQIRKFLDFFFF